MAGNVLNIIHSCFTIDDDSEGVTKEIPRFDRLIEACCPLLRQIQHNNVGAVRKDKLHLQQRINA